MKKQKTSEIVEIVKSSKQKLTAHDISLLLGSKTQHEHKVAKQAIKRLIERGVLDFGPLVPNKSTKSHLQSTAKSIKYVGGEVRGNVNYSVRDSISSALENTGPLTAKQLQNAIGSADWITSTLTRMKRAGQVHIVAWTDDKLSQIYAAGQGENAPRPAPARRKKQPSKAAEYKYTETPRRKRARDTVAASEAAYYASCQRYSSVFHYAGVIGGTERAL